MYAENIDKTNRGEMIKFLENHFTYYKMNSWNGLADYANNVKIYNIKVDDKEIRNNLYDLNCSEGPVAEALRRDIFFAMKDFEHETGYRVFFNGRSSGYLVIDTDFCIDDFEEYNDNYIRQCVEVLEKFDILCDKVVSIAIEYATNYTDKKRKLERIEILERENINLEDKIERNRVEIEMIRKELE